MAGDLLPLLPARPLNADEAFGFRLACSCMATLGRQLEREPTLAGRPNTARTNGSTMRALAEGLARRLGRAG